MRLVRDFRRPLMKEKVEEHKASVYWREANLMKVGWGRGQRVRR